MRPPLTCAAFDGAAQLRLRGGRDVTVRPVEPGDEAALQTYFRTLSDASRYSRTLGAARELPAGELRRVFATDVDHHSLIVLDDRTQRVVGEARLAHVLATDEVEVSLSVADTFQHRGLGTALFGHLTERAARFGTVTMYGDTLRTNAAMLGLAKKHGFRLMPTPGDWRLVRFHRIVSNPMQTPDSMPLAAATMAPREH
jgi:GNAT superfamily N-acetyltransferase